MQLRAVWCLRLIGDTEGPTVIASATWLRGFLPLRLPGTPTTSLTPTDIGVRAHRQQFLFAGKAVFQAPPLATVFLDEQKQTTGVIQLEGLITRLGIADFGIGQCHETSPWGNFFRSKISYPQIYP